MQRNQSDFDCSTCKCSANTVWDITDNNNKKLFETNVCPRKQIDDRTIRFLKLYNHYKNGVLWCEGGLQNQPNVYMEAMQAIENAING